MLGVVACCQASAGHYEVTYSGGTITVTGPSCSDTDPYGTLSNGTYGAGAGTGSCAGILGVGTVACQGQVTATFTWTLDGPNDTEPPPSVALVKQTCTATWEGDSGTCDNGLGDPRVPPDGGNVYEQASDGFEWTAVENPGQTFTVQSTPSATAAFSTGASQLPAGAASVTYKAEAHPIRMTLQGTTPHEGLDLIETGEKLVATVDENSIPSELRDPDPNTEPNDSFTWTRPGSRPFRNYTPETVPSVFEDWADPLTPAMFTYFGQPSPNAAISVTCTVTLATIGLTFPVYRHVFVSGPNIGYNDNPSGAPKYDRMYLLSQPNPPTFVEDMANPNWLKMWGVNPPGFMPTYKVGVHMKLKVGTQPPFYPDLGKWCYAQSGTVRIHIKHSDGQQQWHNDDWELEGLDGGFPYAEQGAPWDALYSDSFARNFADSPHISGLGVPENVVLTYWSLKNDFKLYVFYRPYGSDSKWVPIRHYPWKCGAIALRGSPLWSLAGQDNSFGLYTEYPYPFPMWSRLLTGNIVPGPPP